MTRVLVVDAQPLIREGIKSLLDRAPGLVVVGEAADGAEAVARSGLARPDVVLIGLRPYDEDGLVTMERIRTRALLRPAPSTDPGQDRGPDQDRGQAPDTAVRPPGTIVLSGPGTDSDEDVCAAVRAGADGFLHKDVGPSRLIAAVRAVAEGDMFFSPGITRRLVDAFATLTDHAPPAGTANGLDALTPREVEVMRRVCRGLSNRGIADVLTISEATVKTHLNRAMVKLGLNSRAQVVTVAYESGLVRPGEGGPVHRSAARTPVVH
ncbi:LuxR C-terminal-related transcriptional regulator [Streptomyces sp. NPDC056061]|uniref:LuxR C-terminal-related transcriptional regulator n=1 Tax=Streptomyces sp. NPDC056061 TaxID=3345700 RepID=UPI0035DFFC52